MAKKRKPRKYDFILDKKRLEEVCLIAYRTAEERRLIFSRGIERFLPQWNLPQGLDYTPKRAEIPEQNQLAVSQYLWTIAFFERLNQSDQITLNAHKLWYNPKTKWFFNPNEVASRPPEKIIKAEQTLFGPLDSKERFHGPLTRAIRGNMQFALQSTNENAPEVRFHNNALRLIKDYDADPRNLIKYKTIDEARAHLMRFEGIGTGIANLFIIYMIDRALALPFNSQNALLKVDIHKGRIPINTRSVIPTNHEIYRDEPFVTTLESAYHEICIKNSLNPSILDASLWIIGSELCAKQDFNYCKSCPLYENRCEANVPENKNTGRYVILTSDGKPIDSRKGSHPELEFTQLA